MLIYQGAAAFELWTGKKAPVDVMYRAAQQALDSGRDLMGPNIYLTGFSGSGKSTVGKQVAAMTGWTYRDTDDEIVAATGRAIEDIFCEDGEAAFRKLERSVLESVSQGERQDSDPLRRIISLKAERQPLYALAHWTIHTDELSVTEVASEVVRARDICSNRASSTESYDADLAATVRTSSGDYPVWVAGDSPTRWLAERKAERATSSSRSAAESWRRGRVRGGDLSARYAGRAGPDHARGDDGRCRGGKTAVDLPQGKNLVGAFKQPEFVLADVEALSTLPERALVSGWAEAIKHALILDEPLLRVFEENVDAIAALEPETASDALRRSVAIKADVVSRDERETLGIRAC
ncbi:3-dehydroquinate synthase [Geodia barretti]|uniref:3-dehydroquinate synthase n=1 Tax=Geodia barretti TaxID=519541 RepID=A0AA35RM88_GEOBA|nr:3-dehydroquinate synthase [Geodia barretti]